MKPMTKAIIVALVQILLISSLGAKLLYDRQTRPRAWLENEAIRSESADSRTLCKFAD